VRQPNFKQLKLQKSSSGSTSNCCSTLPRSTLQHSATLHPPTHSLTCVPTIPLHLSLQHSCTRCTELDSTLAGASENVALLKARRELNEKDKMLTKLQTKLDIQADALKQLQATVQSNEQALHEKRLEAATLTSKLRDAELNQRSRSLLGGGVEEHLSRIEQLEAENKVLHQAQADMARAAMSGEQEQHHQRQRDALGAKIKQLQGQVPDDNLFTLGTASAHFVNPTNCTLSHRMPPSHRHAAQRPLAGVSSYSFATNTNSIASERALCHSGVFGCHHARSSRVSPCRRCAI
jgi:hypothetical protein